jgi:dipeptidyl aminopeptidase/acylaminoacyl peptidase
VWWAVLASAGEVADPHRWLERERRPEVEAWWAERDEQARAWASAGERTQQVRAWLDGWFKRRTIAPMLVDRRAGRSLWLRFRWSEPSDDVRPRWGAHLIVQGPGGEQEVDEDLASQPLCAQAQLSPDAGAVVWGRSPLQGEPASCVLYELELEGGDRRELLTGERLSAVWSWDGQSLYVGQQDGGKAVTSRLPRAGGELVELERGRRRMTLLAAPSGELIGRSAATARGRERPVRFAVGEPGQMRWVGPSRPWYDEHPMVLGYREGELLLHSRVDPRGEPEVVRVALDHPHPRRWRTLVTHRPDMDLAYAALHGDELLVVWSRDGQQHLEAQPWDGGSPVRVELPGGPWTSIHLLRAFDDTMTVLARSPVASTLWDRGLDGQMTELPEGSRRSGVVFEAQEIPVEGGTVPVTWLRPEGAVAPGPVWLQVYAGFGTSLAASLSAGARLWVAAGGTYVFVHARGGRERGADWHTSSAGAHLGVRFDEVAEVAQWFVDSGRTEPGRIVLSGTSNGGLTMAATLARRPELFGAAVGIAGVYDLVYGPRHGLWWPEEYGGRHDAEVWPVRLAESPVHRTPAGRLPPVLLVTGERDPVVSPSHTYKLGAAWSELEGGPVLVRVDRGTHVPFTPKDGADIWEKQFELASTMAFVFHALGMEVPPPPEAPE